MFLLISLIPYVNASALGYYPLDDDGNNTEGTLGNFSMTIQGYVTGKVGHGADFEDVADIGSITTASVTEMAKGRCISLFAKPESLNGGSFFRYGNGATEDLIWSKLNVDGTVTFYLANDNNYKFTITSTATLAIGTWSMVTYSVGANGAKLWINTTLAGTDPATDVPNNDYSLFHLGNSRDSDSGFDGVLDNFYVDDEECDTDDVIAWWNDGNGINFSTLLPDTNPASMTLINLSSEGGEGQIIFELGVTNNKLVGEAKTNDTTPTIRATTNESATCAILDWNLNLNYTDAIAYNPASECSTTGGTSHICTLTNDNATGRGLHNFSIGCKDTTTNHNENRTSTSGKFTINITDPGYDVLLKLDGLNESRKYEYKSIVNISAIIPESEQVCIDLDAPNYGYNYSCGDKTTSFLFNITTLRRENFSHGTGKDTLASSDTLNITSNNKTKIELVSFNVSSSGGDIQNLNISYYGQELNYRGDLKTVYLIDDEFIHSGVYKDAVNLSYISKGSNYIYYNLTELDNPINITFDLTGFDFNKENEFSHTEHFNGTTDKGFNNTLSFKVDAPLGVFDEFVINVSGRWDYSNAENDINGEVAFTFKYDNDTVGTHIYFRTYVFDDCTPTYFGKYLDYTGLEADMRNTSRIELTWNEYLRAQPTNSGARANLYLYATDGTSISLLRSIETTNGVIDNFRNVTLLKNSEDYKHWIVVVNGSQSGDKNIGADLDFTKQIKLRLKAYTEAGGYCDANQATAEAILKLYKVEWGGAWLNRSTNNGTYQHTGNITSNVIKVTTTNLTKATLTATTYEPTNTAIDFYLSNTCNATIPTFEFVTSGITHTFDTEGNEICWRATLNSSVNITSPIIRKIDINVIPETINNITIDLGDDGIIEFTHIGALNSTTSPIYVNLTPLNNQMNTMKISSATAGIIQVDNFKVNSSINPITLNESKFEDCSNCVINFTFSGNNLEVSDLKFDFLGSWNYTAIARFSTYKINHTIQVYYSDFNVSLPKNIDWYDVFPSSKDSKNVTPYSQTDSTPIWNVSNLAYDEPINIYVKTNTTIDSCMNITFMNSSNQSNYATDTKFKLNTSYQKILSNISVNLTNYPSKWIWCWEDYSNCTSRYLMYPFYFVSICSDCVYDESDLDYYNIIIE